MSADTRISQLGLKLPPPPKPTNLYRSVVVSGGHAYVAGHGPILDDGGLIIGKVGADMDVNEARAAARQAGLAILSTLRARLGSLDAVRQVVKSLGMVNCTPDFTSPPDVIDGYSELFAEVFGEEVGIGARSAVGVSTLPFGMAVEIEVIVDVDERH